MDEIQGAITCGLWTNLRTAPFEPLACKNTLELMGEFLILAEEVTNLTGSYTDITGRYILVRTDMAIQLVHESLTETHHLIVGASANREVGTSLTATHGQCRQRVLESLFETEELQDAQVDG